MDLWTKHLFQLQKVDMMKDLLHVMLQYQWNHIFCVSNISTYRHYSSIQQPIFYILYLPSKAQTRMWSYFERKPLATTICPKRELLKYWSLGCSLLIFSMILNEASTRLIASKILVKLFGLYPYKTFDFVCIVFSEHYSHDRVKRERLLS